MEQWGTLSSSVCTHGADSSLQIRQHSELGAMQFLQGNCISISTIVRPREPDLSSIPSAGHTNAAMPTRNRNKTTAVLGRVSYQEYPLVLGQRPKKGGEAGGKGEGKNNHYTKGRKRGAVTETTARCIAVIAEMLSDAANLIIVRVCGRPRGPPSGLR